MTRTGHALAIGLLALGATAPLPAAAEGEGGTSDPLTESLDLFEQGAELFLRGLMEEIGPQLEELRPQLRGLADQVGPLVGDLLDLVDDLDAYHAPERLPNGDIILRRKLPQERGPSPLAPPAEGEIDI